MWWLLWSGTNHHPLSRQVADALVDLPEDGIVNVVLTNCLGFSQQLEAGMEVGVDWPVEVVEPQGESGASCQLGDVGGGENE